MAVLRWGSASHEGQLRSQNEDNFHATDGLYVVADGMGGHLAGEVASEIAVNRLSADVAPASASLDTLVAAVNAANTDIYESSLTHADHAGMGTTITAMAVVADPHDGEVFGIANVGDSRAYVMRHQRLRQVTIDHSFVQELVAEGAISRDEARFHPRRNIVTRALGIEPIVRVDSWTMPIIRGDRFVLCSDGLVDEVADEVIQSTLLAHPDDPTAAAQALVDVANESGGRDNITVVIVDVLEGDDPPDPTQEFDVVPMWNDDDLDATGENEIVADPLDGDEPTVDGDTIAAELTGGPLPPPDPEEAAAEEAAVAADLAALVADTDAELDPAATLPPPELYDGAADIPLPAKRRRGGRFVRFLLGVGVAAVLILGFALLAAWARSGYYVAFNDSDEVVVYQGRKESVLWFNPTEESIGQFTRDELDATSVALVEEEPEFSSLASAERFVAERLDAADTADTAGDVGSPATTAPVATPATSTTVRPTTAAPTTTTATTTATTTPSTPTTTTAAG